MTAKDRDGGPAILALDAAGGACSVALWATGRIVSRRFLAMARGQSERLVPMIAEVMADWRGGFAALDAVAVTTGPGGFTGVRIGLATARGLALARALPLIGISSFEVSAAAASATERAGRQVIALIDSKRRDVFLQGFDPQLVPQGPPQELALAGLAAVLSPGPLLLTGDAAVAAQPVLAAAGRQDLMVSAAAGAADAAVLAARAARRWREDEDFEAFAVQPLYLRDPDVTPPKPPRPS